MGFLDDLRYDVRLRNLTVYAQWASLITVLGCWIQGFMLLIPLILAFRHFPSSQLAMQFLNIFLFPLAPLAAALPHLLKYDLWAGLAWWYFLPFAFLSTQMNMYEDFVFGVIYVGWYAILDITFLFLTVFVTTSRKHPCIFWFHFGFTFWISLWVGSPNLHRVSAFPDGGVLVIGPHFEWPTAFAGLSAILHLVGSARGHEIVFSETLGGEMGRRSDFTQNAPMDDERSPLL